jgi:U5 small nuclear ribonucleoprotein component
VSDGVLLCVDVAEGLTLTPHLEEIISYCIANNLRIILVLTKMDRLIVELKLLPETAYAKIRSVL